MRRPFLLPPAQPGEPTARRRCVWHPVCTLKSVTMARAARSTLGPVCVGVGCGWDEDATEEFVRRPPRVTTAATNSHPPRTVCLLR